MVEEFQSCPCCGLLGVFGRNIARVPVLTIARFVEKVDFLGSPDGCWPWTGYRDERYGYGRFTLVGRPQPVRAHRFSYELAVGPIPKGMHIHHKCNNPLCVRPDHLEPTTPEAHVFLTPGNVAYEASRKTHCPKGHPYDSQNTRWEKGGFRKCKKCYADKLAEMLATYRAKIPVEGPATHCKAGHEFTPENTYIRKTGTRACRACARENMALCRKRKAEGNSPGHQIKPHCSNGHEFTEENTYVYNGARQCKTCRRETENRRHKRIMEVVQSGI